MEERNPPIVIYADILISWFLAAVLEIYTQHFTRRLHFTQHKQIFFWLMFCRSGSMSHRYGSADPDPDPHQNFMDPQHR